MILMHGSLTAGAVYFAFDVNGDIDVTDDGTDDTG